MVAQEVQLRVPFLRPATVRVVLSATLERLVLVHMPLRVDLGQQVQPPAECRGHLTMPQSQSERAWLATLQVTQELRDPAIKLPRHRHQLIRPLHRFHCRAILVRAPALPVLTPLRPSRCSQAPFPCMGVRQERVPSSTTRPLFSLVLQAHLR